MRSIDSTLLTAIKSGAICRCVKMTLPNGDVIAVSDSDVDLVVNGITYKPSANLNSIRYNSTLTNQQINNQTLFLSFFEGYVNETDLKGGEYDDCDVETGWIAWDITPKQKIVIFSGKLSRMEYDDSGISFEVLDDTKQLQTIFTRTFTQIDPFTFGDSQFGLNEASYTDSGSISEIVFNRFIFKITGSSGLLAKPSNYYTYGKITFTSGNNINKSFEIKVYEIVSGERIVELFLPTSYSIQVGDTFDIVRGYDGSFEMCKALNNQLNFGGFPHIKPIGEQ